MQVKDDRGAGKQVKRFLPQSVFRACTVVYNSMMRLVPFRWKYAVGAWLRYKRAPYRFLKPSDTVVQVGCARDILHAGRSRAIYFARFVPQGRVILIEADAASCEAARRIVRQKRLENIDVVECGAWHSPTTLAFLSSPHHPAANLLVDAKELSPELVRKRGYEKRLIRVDSIDNILTRLGTTEPALVSITTNGAELQILEGMRQTIARGCTYISLASTGEGFHQHMNRLGYEYIARDDRGYCFCKKEHAAAAEELRRAA